MLVAVATALIGVPVREGFAAEAGASRASVGISAALAPSLTMAVPSSSSRRRRFAHCQESSSQISVEKSVLCLLNGERARRGLKVLRRNRALERAAEWQSHDMVARGYFGHQRRGGPGFVQRIRRTGYLRGAPAWLLGENIASEQGSLASPKRILSAWMTSREHRENILDPSYRDIGLGAVLEGNRSDASKNGLRLTITTDFGRVYSAGHAG